MRHIVIHDLGLSLACRTARAASVDYAQRFQRFDPQILWSGPCRARVNFHAKGLALAGTIEVEERRLLLDLEVPLLLRPFQGKALQIIDRELQRWIERARRGDVPEVV